MFWIVGTAMLDVELKMACLFKHTDSSATESAIYLNFVLLGLLCVEDAMFLLVLFFEECNGQVW